MDTYIATLSNYWYRSKNYWYRSNYHDALTSAEKLCF